MSSSSCSVALCHLASSSLSSTSCHHRHHCHCRRHVKLSSLLSLRVASHPVASRCAVGSPRVVVVTSLRPCIRCRVALSLLPLRHCVVIFIVTSCHIIFCRLSSMSSSSSHPVTLSLLQSRRRHRALSSSSLLLRSRRRHRIIIVMLLRRRFVSHRHCH